MKIFCQFATASTKEVAKRLGKNANYINNIESYFVTNNIINSSQLTDNKIDERVQRIQEFLDNKKEEAKQIRYAIPKYEIEEFNPEIGIDLAYFDPNFIYPSLLLFKNVSDFINWKNKQQNPDLFKTPQDAYLYELWRVMEQTFNGTFSEEAKKIAESKLINYRKEIAPYTKEDLDNNETLKKTTITQSEGIKVEYTPIGKTKQIYTIKGSHIYNKEGKEVFAKNSKDRNKIFANLAVLQGRAVVVQYKNNSYVINDRNQIISVTSGKIMEWSKENGDRKAILEAAKEKFEKKNTNKQSSQNNQQQNNKSSLNFKPEEAEFYSGAAEGSDKAWEEAATKAGIKVTNYTVENWDNLSNEWKEKIDKEYQEVVNTLGRKILSINSYSGKLVRRDMMQADKADAIFAIGTIASNGYVDGGTGYATTRGIQRDIPVYLFDQKDNIWKVWNKEQSKFIPTAQPILTKNAAVIGTRKLQNNGKNAISALIDSSLDRSAGKKFSNQSQETTPKSISGESLFQLDLSNMISQEGNINSVENYAQAKDFLAKRAEQDALEEKNAEERYKKALAYIDKLIKTIPYTGESIEINEESTLTKLGKLLTPTQLNDRINYIARAFSSQIDLAIEEMTEIVKQQLAEAKAEKDETKINKLNHTLKVLENPDKQREKAVKMLGSNTLINRMKQEIQDAIDSSKDPNIKNQYQILSDYFIDIFNLASPIMEQYENVKFIVHKTKILDGSNVKKGATIEMTDSTEKQQNEENAYEDSDDGDRAATGNEGWSFKIKFEDPHNTLTRDVKKVLYNLVKMNGDEIDVDDLGQPRYIAFNQAYAILLDKLANKIVEPQDFIQKDKDGNISYPLLEEMINKFPWVNQVLDALDIDNTDGNGNLGTMFYSAFKRYFTHYYMLRGKKFFPMNEMTSVESALAETTGNYEHGNVLDENSIYNSDKTINQEHINNIREKIKHLDELAVHFNDNYIEIAKELNSILRSVGFNTTTQELTGLVQDANYMQNYRGLKSSINRILSIAEKLENKHLIKESEKEIKKIAPILGNVSELNNCTSFRQNGNNYPSYTPCSFMSNMIEHFKSDKYYKQYIESQFKPYEGWFYDKKENRYLNGWLNLIMNNNDVRNHLSLREVKFIAEGSDDIFGGSQDAVEYNKWMPDQIRKTFLHIYFDTPNDSSSKIQYADYTFPIFSDSEMAAFIRMPKYVKNFRERLIPKLRDVVLQEINRINKVNQREKAGVSKIQHFDKRGKEFLFIPEMNNYRTEIDKFINDNDMSGLNDFIDEKLKEIMNQKVQKALNVSKEEILSYVKDSTNVKKDEEATEKFAEFVWNNAYAQSQTIQLTVTDLAYYKDDVDFQKRFKEVYASGTRFNSESKYGKKNFNIIYLADAIITSNSYKLVEETLNEAVKEKRLTVAEKYNILSMFSKIKSTDGQGFRTLTSYRSMLDMMGQWTPRLQALYERLNNGTWKYEDFENILQTLKPFAYTQTIQNDGLGGKIRVGHQIKDSEFVLLAIYNTLAMGGRKDISKNTGSPQLRALNMFMEENGIDAAIFESGVKTGGQGIVDINHSDIRASKVLETKIPTKNKDKRDYTLADAIMHEYTTYYKSKKEGAKEFSKASPSEKLEWGLRQMLQNGNITQEAFNKFIKEATPTEVEVKEILEKACKTINQNGDVLEDLNEDGTMLNTSVVHSIPTSDYMVAQQNPEHLFDAQSVAGSQNRNLIESDFPANFELKFQDSSGIHTLKGHEINKMCSDLIIENLLEDFETIKKDFKNIESLQKILIKAIQASNKYGNDMINALQIVEVNGKKQFNIPTNNINTLNKLQELVLSVFSNRITKQKNKKGAACTLVSSFGFTNDLHVIKDKKGNLQFEVYMPWHSQKHLAPFLIDVLDDDGKVIGKKIDIEKVKENDPKLLEGFGYRIPTEGKYSMMSFVIKGFLPQENGSTIMMPADTIVYAGEDFDKLCVEVKLR